jgi:NTE family protein
MKKKKIGLVLSGGGARGLAHIGVIKVLLKNNIEIGAIAGTSMGALVGAAYSSNLNIDKLEKEAKEFNPRKFISLFDFHLRGGGLIKGKKLENFLKNVIEAKDFSELNIPLIINATDLKSGKEIIYNSGDLIEAVMASINVPIFITPIKKGDSYIVDGGVVNPLPLELLDNFNFDSIMISSVLQEEQCDLPKIPNFLTIVKRSYIIMQHELGYDKIKYYKNKKLILIEPDVSKYSLYDFKHNKGIIEKGKEAANSKIAEIKKHIK